MATYISNASVGLAAGAFALAETGSGATVLNRRTASSNASNLNSSTFTITSGHVIDGIVLWIQNNFSTASGTIEVALQLSGVDQASVTVNRSDLPVGNNLTPGPVLFKLPSTVTGDGSANWRIALTLSTPDSYVLATTSLTTSDFTRALRTTSTAVPGAGDDILVVGELTGAGTANVLTVTMDQTAPTAYGSGVINSTSAAGGGIHVGHKGVFSYGTSASTNYVLRLNGDLNVWNGGELDIGTSGTPIPSTSTAVLEFVQNTLSGDFGLNGNDGSTINIYGSAGGRNVEQCKLSADFASTNRVPSNTGTSATNGSVSSLPSSGVCTGAFGSFGVYGFTDNSTTNVHGFALTSLGALSNTTITLQFWLTAGSGTNNRYVRCGVGNTSSLSSLSSAFYVDVDLQAGTVSTGSIGTGSVSASSITAYGSGYVVTVTGVVSTSSVSQIPFFMSASALGTTSYSGNSTQCFVVDRVQVYYQAAPAPSQVSLTVDTDTGWKSGDLIAIASTTRTTADCENGVLVSDAGASSLTLALNGLYGHLGTAPAQAEVINLTRNVKIRATSALLMTYCAFSALTTVTMQWAEIYYAGANTTTEAALSVFAGATNNNALKSISYCSIHDCRSSVLSSGSGSQVSWNLVFSHNVMWNVSVSTGPAINVNSSISNTDWTLDSNTLIRTYSGNGISLADIGGTLTNNTVVGAASVGINYAEAATVGSHTGNTTHSNGSTGTQATTGISGRIVSLGSWRNFAFGLGIWGTDLTFDSLTLFGNLGKNIQVSPNSSFTIKNSTIAGDTSFSTGSGIVFGDLGALYNARIESSSFGVASGILTSHSAGDIVISASNVDLRMEMLNTVLGSSTETATPSNLAFASFISSEKADGVAGNHWTITCLGNLQTDSGVFHSNSPSMRMTPTSPLLINYTATSGSADIAVSLVASRVSWDSFYVGQKISGLSTFFSSDIQTISAVNQSAGTLTLGNTAVSTGSNSFTPFLKLESAPKNKGMQVAVDNGGAPTISVWVRKSAVSSGDSSNYNGAQPRLIQRSNSALGISSDVVLATASAAAGSWEQLTATATAASGDAGVLEFIVDCDGTSGFVNVDDWSVS